MIDEAGLTKGQLRKLNALRNSLGNNIADEAFSKWLKSQKSEEKVKVDPVAVKLEEALTQFTDDKSFRLGSKGYVIKRSKGKGASGFDVTKIA